MTRATVAEAREDLDDAVLDLIQSGRDDCFAYERGTVRGAPDDIANAKQYHATSLDALVAAVRAEERERVEPLRRFAKQMLDGARQVDFVADGGSTQGLGERLGLIVATYHETACEDGCICAADYGSDEFPLTCYKDGPLLAAPTTEEPGR